MKIAPGIPAGQESRAADLYWQAFRTKLRITMGPDPKGLAYVTRVLRTDHAISAVAPDGTLLGVVGFKTYQGALVGGGFDDLRAVYGTFGALWRAAFLAALERDVENERFLMDGIFVHADARGKGVGTALLEAVCDEAAARGYSQIRLDVIDVNQRAKALYERRGFAPSKVTRLGLLRYVFGFAASTTMVRQLQPHDSSR